MNQLFANWQIIGDNGIYVDGESAYQFLVLGIAMLLISFFLIAIFAYYLWSFNKREVEMKMMNKPLINITFVLPSISFILGIILLLFWSIPATIFGDNGDTLFASYVSIAIIGFIILVVNIVTMWIWLPKFAIGLTKNQILFVGDYIPYSKITKIIKDDKDLYINYTLGKRTLKKQKFSLSSVFGQFLLANAESVIGYQVEEISQAEYVESFTINEDFENQKVVEETKTVSVKEIVSEPTTKVIKKKSTTKKVSQPIGKKVPDPKPVVFLEDEEVEITNHKVEKYQEKKKK
jgi:hypothetical protein